jgi:hypothetical protein
MICVWLILLDPRGITPYDEPIKAFPLAGMSESTQQTYARSLRKLIEFYNEDP